MAGPKKEERKFIRLQVRRLTSIVKQQGKYELLEEALKKDLTLLDIKDISTGGLRIESEDEFIKGTSFELTIPKIKKLDRAIVKCEVTRSEFNDGNYVYDVGLRFIPANTDYLKELIELLKLDRRNFC
jgi:hypothetical protein